MNVNSIRQYAVIPPRWVTWIYENYGISTMINPLFGRYGINIEGNWIPQVDYADPTIRKAIREDTLRAVEIFNALEVRSLPPACYDHIFCWSTPLCSSVIKLILALSVLGIWVAWLHKKTRPDYWTARCGRCHALAVKATPAYSTAAAL